MFFALNLNNVLRNGCLSSPADGKWEPKVPNGSFYLELVGKIEENLENRGDWVIMHSVSDGKKTTMLEALDMGKRFAALLSRRGVGEGDCVHLFMENDNNFLPMCFGIWIVGGVVSVGDAEVEAETLARQIEDTEAKVLVIQPEFAKLAKAALDLCSASLMPVEVLSLGEGAMFPDLLEEIKATSALAFPQAVRARDVMNDIAVVVWSSGTTGHPKGICHTHFTATNDFGTHAHLLTPGSNQLVANCFFHITALRGMYNALLLRQTYCHMSHKTFDAAKFLGAVAECQPSTLELYVAPYVQLADADLPENTDPSQLSCVKYITPLGVGAPQSCEAKIRQKFQGLLGVVNSYGTTESGLVSGGLTKENMGTLHPTVTVKVVNPDTGLKCGPGERGEICVKMPYIMKGYLKNPKATAGYFDAEGFGRTGDLGHYGLDGKLYISDRLKDVITYRSLDVVPGEVEEILKGHPAVKESLVFGKPDRVFHEIVSAVVVLVANDGIKVKVTEEELIEFANAQLVDYKRIRGGIVFRESLPRTTTGKLRRVAMRDWARKQQEQEQVVGSNGP